MAWVRRQSQRTGAAGSAVALAFALLVSASGAGAQSVALQGMLGSKALLIVDGAAPKTVAPGETYKGVKVLSTSGDQAQIEVAGQRFGLRVGESPASVGSTGGTSGGGGRIVLTAGSGGHFLTGGRINGQQVQFMVDTGATDVALSEDEARRIGLNFRQGVLARMGTANGVVTVWRLKLASVRVGEVELHDIDATVVPAGMPYVLLGNSFLGRFQMKRENELMVLERRY
jgi:aspartyl protease family protein